MADDHTRDDLTQLRAIVTTLQARLARVERRKRLPRRVLPLALVALLVALLPLSILAAGPVFSDLGTAAPVHQPNIQAIGDAGITTGFEDPAHPGQRLYNPKDLVTREEMASFLARTAGLGANPPVANAKNAQTATTAANATQLGGVPATSYVQITSHALPLAFATVAADGTKLSGTPNVTVTRTSAGRYTITIAGVDYFFPDYTALATIVGTSGEIVTDSVSGNLLVNTNTSTGTPSDRIFQVVVFRP